jgi:hypothetical protein
LTPGGDEEMIKMNVVGVAMDSKTNVPIILLRDEGGNKVLPIWVGLFEAQAILFALEDIETPRPMTHDLLKNVLDNLGAKLEKVVINALQNNTFFAKLTIVVDGNSYQIDSRPSDAIALALRTSSPIFITDPVLNAATMPPDPIREDEIEKFREMLKNIKPTDI